MSTHDRSPDLHGGSRAPYLLVIVSAGISDPSSTRLLADRIAAAVEEAVPDRPVRRTYVDLAPLAVSISQALVAGFPDAKVTDAITALAEADGVVVSTPVYKAGISGLLKSFVDILDNDLLIGKPTILAASAGSPRHAMVVDEQMRPLFAFMRALTVPTSVFAAPEDWASADLTSRIARAATELAILVRAGSADTIAEQSWSRYQHQFGSHSASPAGEASAVDFDTSLMRLATGGRAPAAEQSQG